MSYSLEEIEDVGPDAAAKLRAAGVKSTSALLARGKTPAGRKELVASTGISHDDILTWCNKCDLMRIKGVATQYSDLLEEAGVDTVKELRNRNAGNLHAKMQEVNAEKKLVRVLPSLKQVESWVAQAKELPPTMEY